MEDKDKKYIDLMNKSINQLVKDALRTSKKLPFLLQIGKILRHQRRAARLRHKRENQGLHVPPFMIFSITRRCNLRCAGCYALNREDSSRAELTPARISSILQESRQLGISIAIIAGGEPFTRPELLDITARYPGILFPIFTNGLLLDPATISRLRQQKNLIPILSLEGDLSHTDTRRGQGVHDSVNQTAENLRKNDIFFGISLTVTSANFSLLSSRDYVEGLLRLGARVLFYVEYVPVSAGSEGLVVSDDQRRQLEIILDDYRGQYPSLFIAFPGDESRFGGCLSSGRGFIHISPEGDVEPCPFAPYSDTNLQDVSLEQALRSELLAEIRSHPEELRETESGCALWNRRDWVRSLQK